MATPSIDTTVQYHRGRFLPPYLGQKRAVSQFTKDGKLVRTYPSINEAAFHLFICGSSISSVLKGKTKTAGGYVWKYTNQIPTTLK